MIFIKFRNRGQVFPFLLVALVVVIIVAMITVNLGQIGIFKTDVSNAADAGALAAASTLSGYLLGIGLLSDQMLGLLIVEIIGIIIFCCTVIGIVAAIILLVCVFIKQMVNYFKALNDGKMAWGNAKKSALQYAFSNSGIDEPRPSFNQFVENVYGLNVDNLSPAEIAKYNEIYTLGDDPALPKKNLSSAQKALKKKIKKYTQSGFSSFMEENYFWNEMRLGKISPGHIYPGILTAGYGWQVDDQGNVTNSYPSLNYKDYDNYVEVTVYSSVMYPLKLYEPISQTIENIFDYIDTHTQDIWYLSFLGKLGKWVGKIIGGIIKTIFPGGLQFKPDIKTYTDDNPIVVTVRRYKRNKNLGLWNFRYGVVQASAVSHLYGEDDGDGVPHDIKPTLGPRLECFASPEWCWISAALEDQGTPIGLTMDSFDTTKHLFESELTSTY
ncbi:MAG: pilus assembly protein TadG-related protein [Candidatus Omnitrophica bacterium]|jgi:hypothetical protein|nr:pilus assembly protein TadG-related protein [Candidatus Omnitrophota bacterium]